MRRALRSEIGRNIVLFLVWLTFICAIAYVHNT